MKLNLKLPGKKNKADGGEKKKLGKPQLIILVILVGAVALVAANQMGFIHLPFLPDKTQSANADPAEGESSSEGGEPSQEGSSSSGSSADSPSDPSSEATVAPTDTKPDRSDWRLNLINNDNFVPSDFRVNLVRVQGGYLVDSRISDSVDRMVADAAAQGVDLQLCSAYRNVAKQRELYDAKIQEYASAGYSKEESLRQAMLYIAKPGCSEHHIGLAVDFVTPSYQKLDEGFANTKAYEWLKANAASYGFILRYPDGKTSVTHISFEPWHYRYVGEENARKITDQGITLEEYLGVLPKATPETPAALPEDAISNASPYSSEPQGQHASDIKEVRE